MIDDKLLNANELFALGRYQQAYDIYKRIFPQDIHELINIFDESRILKHVFKNYLCCLLGIQDFKSFINFYSRYKALCPSCTTFDALDNITRKYYNDNHEGPLLSIIVPVHNSGQYLDHCITSIREQTFSDFELIIVNDGSTDNSGEIIHQHKLNDQRIKVIENKAASGNPGTPRNQALEISRGLYVGFVDSDDWINRDYYEGLMSIAMSERTDIVFSGGFYNHEADGRTTQRLLNAEGFNDPSSTRFKVHDSFMIWDKVFRKSLIDTFKIRLGETKAAVDVPFIFAAYYFCSTVAHDDNLLGYNYRRESESSVTVAHRKNSNCEFEFQAFNNVNKWAASNALPDYYLTIINIKMVSSLMYTLKMVSDDYFNDVFLKVKSLFKKIDDKRYKQFCIDNKKWWQYKEFSAVVDQTAEEVRQFLLEKEAAAEQRKLEALLEPRFQIEGKNKGLLFFPCWLQSNPYQKLLYEEMNRVFDISIEGFEPAALCKELIKKKKGKFKYIHLHWLQNFFDFFDSAILENTIKSLKFAKTHGFKIVYTAHNISSHDSPNRDVEKAARTEILSLVDYFLAHGEHAKQTLISEFRVNPNNIFIVPHGSYGSYYGDVISKTAAKKQFGLPTNSTVFLFFGNIKGYKGVFNLIDSFKILRRSHENIYLIITGRVLDDFAMSALAENTQDKNILFRPGFVQDDEVVNYFSCADLCVLPYERVLTSGAAMLSLSMMCPVLAPTIGVLPEVIDDDVGLLFDNFEEMTKKMATFVSDHQSAKLKFNFDNFLQNYSWKNLIRRASFLEE